MNKIKLLIIPALLSINMVLCPKLRLALAGSDKSCRINNQGTLSARIVLCLPDFAESFTRQNTTQQAKLLENLPRGSILKNTIKTGLPGRKHTVLFLCNANMERSPMAARLTRLKMPADLIAHFKVDSAALKDKDCSGRQLEEFTSRNYLLKRHIPLRVTPQQLREAAIIFVMTQWQREAIYQRYPSAQGKVFLLMGKKELHPVPEDYPDRGPTYQKLQNSITLRLPMIYKKLREFLINKDIRSSLQKNIIYPNNSILIRQAI